MREEIDSVNWTETVTLKPFGVFLRASAFEFQWWTLVWLGEYLFFNVSILVQFVPSPLSEMSGLSGRPQH